jgi:hypothetical protein
MAGLHPRVRPEGSTFFQVIDDSRRSRWDPIPANRKRDRSAEEEPSAAIVPAAAPGVPVAAIVPAAARRAHRRVAPDLDPDEEVVVPAVGFGFDEIPAVDEAIVPILWDAGLVSALALSVPACTRGGAAPTGSLDVLMAEFSGGSCIGRDARRSKHFLFCYLHLFGEIEDVYAHFKSQPAFVGHVCSDVVPRLLSWCSGRRWWGSRPSPWSSVELRLASRAAFHPLYVTWSVCEVS